MFGSQVRVTVSALSSPYLSMLRDCKCQVSGVCLSVSQLPWTRKRKHTRVARIFRITRSGSRAARYGFFFLFLLRSVLLEETLTN